MQLLQNTDFPSCTDIDQSFVHSNRLVGLHEEWPLKKHVVPVREGCFQLSVHICAYICLAMTRSISLQAMHVNDMGRLSTTPVLYLSYALG